MEKEEKIDLEGCLIPAGDEITKTYIFIESGRGERKQNNYSTKRKMQLCISDG